MDSAVAGKLWDGATWHRPVMDKSRAFTVKEPWFGIFSAGHVPDLFKAMQEARTLSCYVVWSLRSDSFSNSDNNNRGHIR